MESTLRLGCHWRDTITWLQACTFGLAVLSLVRTLHRSRNTFLILTPFNNWKTMNSYIHNYFHQHHTIDTFWQRGLSILRSLSVVLLPVEGDTYRTSTLSRFSGLRSRNFLLWYTPHTINMMRKNPDIDVPIAICKTCIRLVAGPGDDKQ